MGRDASPERGAAGEGIEVLTDEMKESLDRVELTRLTRAYNAAFADGAQELARMMGEPVEAGSLTAISGTGVSLCAVLPPELLTVDIRLSGSVDGSAKIVISADDAAALADRLSGSAAGDDQAWAANMTRALERFIAAAAERLRAQSTRTLAITPSAPEVCDTRTAPLIPADEMCVRLSIELRIGQVLAVQVHQLLSLTLARAILGVMPGAVPPGPQAPPATAPPSFPTSRSGASEPQAGIDRLINAVLRGESDFSADSAGPDPDSHALEQGPQEAVAPSAPAIAVQQALFADLAESPVPMSAPRKIDVLMNVPVQLAVEVGRVEVSVREILQMAPGSVMSIARPAGEPVTLMLNGRPIGRAEIVEIDGDYGIRIVEIARVARSSSAGAVDAEPDA